MYFLETGFINITSASSLRKGLVKDYLYPTVYGRGYNSSGKLPLKGTDCVLDKARVKWKDMMTRCYGKNSNTSSYTDCEVCEEWWDFKVFLDWYRSKIVDEKYTEYHLDKDFLNKGVKIYSEDTCILLPRKINNLLYRKKKVGKTTCVGVWKRPKGRFQAYTNDLEGNRIALGEYNTEEEAFLVFKEQKEKVIKDAILHYKESLHKDIIDVLRSLKVCRDGYYLEQENKDG